MDSSNELFHIDGQADHSCLISSTVEKDSSSENECSMASELYLTVFNLILSQYSSFCQALYKNINVDGQTKHIKHQMASPQPYYQTNKRVLTLNERISRFGHNGHPLIIEIFLVPNECSMKHEDPSRLPVCMIEQWTIQLLHRRLVSGNIGSLSTLTNEINNYSRESTIYSWLEQNHHTACPPKIAYRITNLCSACQFSLNWLYLDTRELSPHSAFSWDELDKDANDYGCLLDLCSSQTSLTISRTGLMISEENQSSPEFKAVCRSNTLEPTSFIHQTNSQSQFDVINHQVLTDLCVNCCSFTGVEIGPSDVLEVSVNTVQTNPLTHIMKCPLCSGLCDLGSPNFNNGSTLTRLRKTSIGMSIVGLTSTNSSSPSSSSDYLRRVSVENSRFKKICHSQTIVESSSPSKSSDRLRKSSFVNPTTFVQHFKNLSNNSSKLVATGEDVAASIKHTSPTQPREIKKLSTNLDFKSSSPVVLVASALNRSPNKTEVLEYGIPVTAIESPPRKQPRISRDKSTNIETVDTVINRFNQLQTAEEPQKNKVTGPSKKNKKTRIKSLSERKSDPYSDEENHPSCKSAGISERNLFLRNSVSKTMPIPQHHSSPFFRGGSEYFNGNSMAFFNRQTGLPLQSSPVPLKRSVSGRFDYDVSLGVIQNLTNSSTSVQRCCNWLSATPSCSSRPNNATGARSPLSAGWTSPVATYSSSSLSGGGPNASWGPDSLSSSFKETSLHLDGNSIQKAFIPSSFSDQTDFQPSQHQNGNLNLSPDHFYQITNQTITPYNSKNGNAQNSSQDSSNKFLSTLKRPDSLSLKIPSGTTFHNNVSILSPESPKKIISPDSYSNIRPEIPHNTQEQIDEDHQQIQNVNDQISLSAPSQNMLTVDVLNRYSFNLTSHPSTVASILLGPSTPMPISCSQNLLVNFEESMLNGRIHPVGQVDGFELQVGASGCNMFPKHERLAMQAYFFHLSDDNAPSPYLGYVDLRKLSNRRGYHIPRKGSLQLTLFNPSGAVVKMFVIMYDFEDMPPNCQTFLRQRTVYMPITPPHLPVSPSSTTMTNSSTSSDEDSTFTNSATPPKSSIASPPNAPRVDYGSFGSGSTTLSAIVTPSVSGPLHLSAAIELEEENKTNVQGPSYQAGKSHRKKSITTTRSGSNLPIIDRPWTIGLNSVYEGGFPGKSLRKKSVHSGTNIPQNVQTAPRSGLPANLRYSIHLRFHSSKRGRVYLHTDVRMIFSRDKFEFDPSVAAYELKSFIDAPSNPRYSPKN